MENNWIENVSGECPVEEGTLIDVTYRDGEVKECLSALTFEFGRDSTHRFWCVEGMQNDIIKWRRWESEQSLDDALGQSESIYKISNTLTSEVDNDCFGSTVYKFPQTTFKPSSEAQLRSDEAARVSSLLSEKLSTISDIASKLTRKNFSVADIKLVKDLLESVEEYEENR